MQRQLEPRLPVKARLAERPLSIGKVARTARRNLLEIIPELATWQKMVSGRLVKRWHMVMDPGGLRRILRDRVDAYPKAAITKSILRPAIGESLFIAEGGHWQWQRRAAASAFATRSIRNLAPVMAAATQTLIDRVRRSAPGPTDLCAEVTAATFEVISDVTFAEGTGMERQLVHSAIDSFVNNAARASLLDVIGAPEWIPRMNRLFTHPDVREMKRIATQVIEERRVSGRCVADLHDLLASGVDPETGRRMNPIELRDNLLTFIVAGHETTALALSWSLYLLAFDSCAQDRVRQEAEAALAGDIATPRDLEHLPFTRQVVREALRLYPPAALLLRTAMDSDVIGGREVRPGDTMLLPIYALHRNHCFWKNPDTFCPDRFSDPNIIHSHAYLPFGAGPRACIGSGFAMQEAVIMLSALIAEFHFSPVADRQPEPVMILTLRPKGGVWLTVQPVQRS
ncbi:MAG: cytochrome P450 [Rhodobacteraceae bacterium]|nr:cytochrome P450 [Paracoccaceae bacterium]